MTKTLETFLSKKAADEIFVLLYEDSHTFTEIVQHVAASKPTIADRLKEGVEMDLWHEVIEYPDEGPKRKEYTMKPTIREGISAERVDQLKQAIHQRKAAVTRHQDVISEFDDHVEFG